MLEEIIDVYIKQIKQKALADKKMTHVPLGYLMTLDIPQSIKHFFDQEVELWIREEEEKFSSSDRFNYDLPEVRVLIDQIFDILKNTAQFHITKFNQLLERAVKLQMNFVIEPHRTLTQFLFKDKNTISTIDVYDTLKYFFQFEYYKEAISDYFNTKYLKEINQDQFAELLNRIDERVFAENREEMTLKMIKTILAFLSDAQGTQVTTIPSNVLLAALRDRNLTDLVVKFEKAQKEIQFTEITFEEIEGILFGQPEEGVVVEKEAIREFDEVETLETEEIKVELDDVDVSEIKPSDKAVVEEEEEEEYEEEEEEEEETKIEELPQEQEEPAKEIAAELMSPEEEVVVSKAADELADHLAKQISGEGPLADLNTMIKGRDRKRIIKKLFKKNEKAFIGFINQLNSMTTWKEASRFIDDTFYELNINPYSKEAILFSDIVYMRFFPKDKYIGGKLEEESF